MMSWPRFLYAVTPSLVELARALFTRHKGDPKAANAEIARIPDYWVSVKSEDAVIDEQLEELRKQGK